MNNNQIHFNVHDNKVKVSFKTPPSMEDFFTIVSTGILSAMQQVVTSQPEENREQCKEELYDMYNAAASNTLAYFAPEYELRPHLTTQAILEAENKLIDEAYQEKKRGKIINFPYKH